MQKTKNIRPSACNPIRDWAQRQFSASSPKRRTRRNSEQTKWAEAVIEIAAAVYGILGEGNLESVYENAMAVEFRKRGIPYAIENNVEVLYKGESVGMQRLDFVIGGTLAVELKPVSKINRTRLY